MTAISVKSETRTSPSRRLKSPASKRLARFVCGIPGEEGLRVVGRPRRHHGYLNQRGFFRRDPEEVPEALRDGGRGRRRPGQQGGEGGKGVRGEPQLPPRPLEFPPEIRDPRGRPEGPPVRRTAARELLPGKEIGEEEGRLHRPPA